MARRRRRQKRKNTKYLALLILIAVGLIGGTYYMQMTNTIHVESGDQVRVIDVSVWNKKIKWNKVKKQSIYYAMLRVGRGATKENPMAEDQVFAVNYRNGKRYHMNMGVYFYSYAKTPKEAKAEAKYCLKLLNKNGIKPENLTMPVAFDIEEAAVFQTGRKNVTELTRTFCETIKEAGYTPMVYSSASNLIRYFRHSVIKNYKIWVAHYGVEDSGPSYPYRYDMWQYTSDGIVPGANTSGQDDKGNCDINYYIIQ